MIKKFFHQIFKKYKDKKIFMIGNSHILNARRNYESIENLSDLDYQIFSQNGEDGILDYLLYQLKIQKPKFLEGKQIYFAGYITLRQIYTIDHPYRIHYRYLSILCLYDGKWYTLTCLFL